MRRSTSVAFFLGVMGLYAIVPSVSAGPLSGRALSIGYPNGGKLIGGRRFRDTPHMKTVPSHDGSTARWALPALLRLLDRASRAVASRYPGSVLGVGELSNRDGGPIASHHSHQNGRDADIGFYLTNERGRVLRPLRFIPCDQEGRSREVATTQFDDRRNWALVRALLEDDRAPVRQIFVYAPLKARLLAYAEKVGAPSSLRAKAALVMIQPSNALPHDDHFHVRIACPADQVREGCIDDARRRETPDEIGPSSTTDLGPSGINTVGD
jgi:penicillin-insensitive murein endopeptidase